MDFGDITTRGMVLLGCGKMGGAMLQGWLAGGLAPSSVWILDPFPSDWVKAQGAHLNAGVPGDPAIAVIADTGTEVCPEAPVAARAKRSSLVAGSIASARSAAAMASGVAPAP